jgi:hypothetical protein
MDYVWTAPLGVLWHLTHGSSITIAHRQIAIPWDMTVSNSDDGVAISRIAPAKDIFHAPSGIILVSTSGRSFDFHRDHDLSARAYSNVPPGARYDGESDFSGTSGREYCWEASAIDMPYVSVVCSFDQSTLSADFVGSMTYRQKFYGIAASLAGATAP